MQRKIPVSSAKQSHKLKTKSTETGIMINVLKQNAQKIKQANAGKIKANKKQILTDARHRLHGVGWNTQKLSLY
ncbi:MAG: hypothetical protein IIZ39_09635 [Blautia sp.]|nr:hypothetical protein [Blautia sp.]